MKIILKVLFLLLFLSSPSWATSEWLVALPAAGDLKSAWPAASQGQNSVLDRLLATYSNMYMVYESSTTITIAPGSITCSNSGATLRHMRLNTTSTDVTFSNIDTGASAPNTTYYMYADCDASAATATFVISLSASAPTGVTYYAQMGSFATDSSTNIYLLNNYNINGEYGAPSSKSVGVVYHALVDGDVVGIIIASSSSDSGYITGYTDSSSSPTTVMGYASENENSQADHSNTRNSFRMPVSAGNYFEVTQGTWGGASTGGTATVYFVPKNR